VLPPYFADGTQCCRRGYSGFSIGGRALVYCYPRAVDL